ncbi:MAG: hypothetical protein WDN45_16395 [Caulobacteraceae bacterium]
MATSILHRATGVALYVGALIVAAGRRPWPWGRTPSPSTTACWPIPWGSWCCSA